MDKSPFEKQLITPSAPILSDVVNFFQENDPIAFGVLGNYTPTLFSIFFNDHHEFITSNNFEINNLLDNNHNCGGMCFRAYHGNAYGFCCNSAENSWKNYWCTNLCIRDKKTCSRDPNTDLCYPRPCCAPYGCKQFSWDAPDSCCNAFSENNHTDTAKRYAKNYFAFCISDSWRFLGGIFGSVADVASIPVRVLSSLFCIGSHYVCVACDNINKSITESQKDDIAALIYNSIPKKNIPIFTPQEYDILLMSVQHLGLEETRRLIHQEKMLLETLKYHCIGEIFKSLKLPIFESNEYYNVHKNQIIALFKDLVNSQRGNNNPILHEIRDYFNSKGPLILEEDINLIYDHMHQSFNYLQNKVHQLGDPSKILLIPDLRNYPNNEHWIISMIWMTLLIKQHPMAFNPDHENHQPIMLEML